MRRFLVLVVGIATVASAGCGTVDHMRRDFVAPRYIQQAEAKVHRLPRDPGAAERAADRALRLMPDAPELQLRAARVYASARAWEKAIRLFEAQANLATLDQLTYALCLLEAERRELGAEICLRVINRAHRDHQQGRIGRLQWALLLNNAGYILADADIEVDRAYAAVTEAVEAFPLQAAFVDSRGWALYRQGKLNDAAFYLERARRHAEREDPEVLYHLGVVYGRLERYGEAYDVLTRAQELDPDWEPITEELRRLGRILPPPALCNRHRRSPSMPILRAARQMDGALTSMIGEIQR